MPDYSYDTYHYRLHKANGGTFSNYNHKSYLHLSEIVISKHLQGLQQNGIYPLLQDNTSWFLVADFDKSDWQRQALKFLEGCRSKNVPDYLQRSRSGNGAHVWIFFEEPYPASKSRKIFMEILEWCGAFSPFDKSSSFDRLFPNQEYLTGKGLGNLIALALFLPAVQKGNSSFVDPKTMDPIADQIGYLKRARKMSLDLLDELYNERWTIAESNISNIDEKLKIILSNTIKSK